MESDWAKPCHIESNCPTQGLAILVAPLTAREHNRIFHFAITLTVQHKAHSFESIHQSTKRITQIKDKMSSGPKLSAPKSVYLFALRAVSILCDKLPDCAARVGWIDTARSNSGMGF